MRHLARHLQATVHSLVRRHLAALDWTGPAAAVPFGALPVTVQADQPSEAQLQSIRPNLVAVSFGQQADETETEMGGGPTVSDQVLFIDVLAENSGIGLALAEDLRDLLIGRSSYPDRVASRYFRLEDQTTVPPTPVVGYLGEIVEVFREPAERQVAGAHWQVLRATIALQVPGED